MTSSRSVASASVDVLSVPSPASGICTCSAFPPGATSTWIGSSAWPDASARSRRSATAACRSGSDASPAIATTAGVAPPGNASFTLL